MSSKAAEGEGWGGEMAVCECLFQAVGEAVPGQGRGAYDTGGRSSPGWPPSVSSQPTLLGAYSVQNAPMQCT